MAFDIDEIRAQFPILQTTVHGHPLTYLDNAATTQMPEPVLGTILEQHRIYEANVHRGVHYLSEMSTGRMEAAREKVRSFLHAKDTAEIVFTGGTTAAINLVARSFSERFLGPGDEVLTTAMEHHSNLIPWQKAAERTGAVCRVLPMDESGELRLDLLPDYLTDRTRLVAVCGVSNVLGTVNPLDTIIRAAHAIGACVLVDGAQMVRHIPVDVQSLDCDFFAFSAHKVYGPTGAGVLYGKRKWLEQLPPVEFGGGMAADVTEEHASFTELPHRLEAGTPNIAGNIALGTALDYLTGLGAEAARREAELLACLEKGLSQIQGLHILGCPGERAGAVSFWAEGAHPYDIAVMLDQLGIAVRSGKHCAAPLHSCFGIESSVRISTAVYNTEEEADRLVRGLEKVLHLLRKARP